jgi:hypothetical protein
MERLQTDSTAVQLTQEADYDIAGVDGITSLRALEFL